MRMILERLTRKSFPKEMFQLHVKDFQLEFATVSDYQMRQPKVFPMVSFKKGKIVFLQIYLMPRAQLEELLPVLT